MEELKTVLISLAVAVIPVLTPFIIAYINKLRENVKAKTDAAIIDKYIDIVTDVIIDTIDMLTQTIVNDLKTRAADGKLTDEDAKAIKAEAVDTIMETLNPKIVAVLAEVFIDVRAWVSNKIEAILLCQKKEEDES